MPRPERGKTKTNQAISMRLYLNDDFQKRKKILLWQPRMRKSLPFLFFMGRSIQGWVRGGRSSQRTNATPQSFDPGPGRKSRRDS
ncbi:MAG TPA: hypothetical protein VGO06_03920 [Bosea sp. (in: a-proteobacteria)]|uniref:hypothetical protein n=1 Tax=Bosea sp. (in: a-proteobacteria) TaxID=1871050 RepID=UPI002E0EFE02|nr:hypothetical protein [Bosea sp. (in: a-proteobacteria)]